MAMKILTVIRQNPAFTLLYSAKCLIYESHSVSHKAEACLQFLVLPKASIYSHQFLISILTSVGKICLPIVSLQTKGTFFCGLCSYCTLQSVEEHLAEPCFMPLVLLMTLRHLRKSFLALSRPFPKEMKKGPSQSQGNIAIVSIAGESQSSTLYELEFPLMQSPM